MNLKKKEKQVKLFSLQWHRCKTYLLINSVDKKKPKTQTSKNLTPNWKELWELEILYQRAQLGLIPESVHILIKN